MVSLTQSEPDSHKPMKKPDQLGPVKAWSYSALKVFEECPYRTYIQRIKKIPEPSSPAADRGSQIPMRLSNMWMVVSKIFLVR